MRVVDAETVDEGIENVAGLIDLRAIEIEDLVKAGVKHIAERQHSHDKYHRQNARQRHMQDLLDLAGAVNLSGLVERRVDATHGSEIDDRTIAEVFPCIRNDQRPRERAVFAEEIHRFSPEEPYDLINKAV